MDDFDFLDETILQPAPETDGMVILCVSNAYKKQFYLNPKFARLPEGIKEELQITCVLYTSDVGGILTLRYDAEGNLLFHVASEDNDYFFDEIGSVLKIKEIQRNKQELLEALELYYKAFFLKEDISELL
jgi:hypothetical protein